jgi:glycosyltransferase involved in cell wall biosynthesis
MINILFIHQSAELYGSDKTLLLLLSKLDKTIFNPIVVLPSEGPLKDELEKEEIKVSIAPVLKLFRKMFSPNNIFLFSKDIKKGISILDELHKEYKFDLVYSNTLAVLLGFIYAKKRKIKHVWHVHEIIESPKVFKKIFRKILGSSDNIKIVYNSIATQFFWNLNPKNIAKTQVIWNGSEIPEKIISNQEIVEIREKMFHSNEKDIVIALVGRISRWKGQLVLLKAFYDLSKVQENIKLVFIGSPPPNQEGFLESLHQQIEKFKISQKVIIIPFQDKITAIWQSIDIAVIPSSEPEPFGLVAVEAMLAKKPVIGSNHGGLTEILIDNETGFLVKPNNEKALSEALLKLIENPELRNSFGEKGYQRAIKEFSADKYVQSFENLFNDILND